MEVNEQGQIDLRTEQTKEIELHLQAIKSICEKNNKITAVCVVMEDTHKVDKKSVLCEAFHILFAGSNTMCTEAIINAAQKDEDFQNQIIAAATVLIAKRFI